MAFPNLIEEARKHLAFWEKQKAEAQERADRYLDALHRGLPSKEKTAIVARAFAKAEMNIRTAERRLKHAKSHLKMVEADEKK